MPSILRQLLSQQNLGGRFAGHKPHFRLREFAPKHWWIMDGDIQVGSIVRGIDFAELMNCDPCHPVKDIAFPRYYHAPTLTGDRFTLAKWVSGSEGTCSQRSALDFAVRPGGATATFTECWADGRTAHTQVTWRVDTDFGYVAHCVAGVRYRSPETIEFCNFHAQHVMDDRPEFARYPYLLWQHPSGKVHRWNHNHLSATAKGIRDIHGQRQIAGDGFIGCFGEPDRNPLVEFTASSPVAAATTCPPSYEEHIMWAPTDLLGHEGAVYISRAEYRVLSVPGEISELLASRAMPVDLMIDPADPSSFAAPLRMDVIADFATTVDPREPYHGAYFRYPPNDANAPISIVSGQAHSGTRSLRILADSSRVEATTSGGHTHVTGGQHYRLSAWLKTDLSEGAALLCATEYLFSRSNVTGDHRGAPVSGRHDWQQVTVEFTPGEQAHVVEVSIRTEGRGIVWVDDILLERLR